LPIPGNDDSMRSIDLIMNILADAIAEGKASAATKQLEQSEGVETTSANGASNKGASTKGASNKGASAKSPLEVASKD